MKKKFIIFLLIITIPSVGYIFFQRANKIVGKKIIEQIVNEYNSPKENSTQQESIPEDDIPIQNTEDKNSAGIKTENNNLESKPDMELPSDIMNHPYVKNIYKRFSAAEIAEVSSMLPGGFTSEEKTRAKQIVLSKVSKSEINRLQEIYKLYQN